MATPAANLEHAVAKLVTRSRLAELAAHGNVEWTAVVGSEKVPLDTVIALDEQGNVVISFLMVHAPGNADMWNILAGDSLVQSVPGRIVAGRNCHLRLVYQVEPDTARV